MADKIASLGNAKVQSFIAEQKMYFTATSALGKNSRINVSPKGYSMDCFRIEGEKVFLLDLSGSGIETIAHVKDNGRITLMFISFDEKPGILRMYGKAKIHEKFANWFNSETADTSKMNPKFIKLRNKHFAKSNLRELASCRSVIEIDIDLILGSCGFAVPRMKFVGERTKLKDGHAKKKLAVFRKHWQGWNERSLDNLPGLSFRYKNPIVAATDFVRKHGRSLLLIATSMLAGSYIRSQFSGSSSGTCNIG